MVDSTNSPLERANLATNRPPELIRDYLWRDIRYITFLLASYFRVDPVVGGLLASAMVAANVLIGTSTVQMQVHMAAATDGLVARNSEAAYGSLTTAFSMFGAVLALWVLGALVEFVIRIRWRKHYTNKLLTRWLKDDRFVHLEKMGGIDFPEQRIQESLYNFAEQAVTFVPRLAGILTGLYLYSGKLWELSSDFDFSVAGSTFTIPSYMFFIAVVFGLALTVITHKLGVIFTRVEVVRQGLEAGFRHDLSQIRSSSEAIALEGGADFEKSRAEESFALICRNWWHYMRASIYLNITASASSLSMSVLPMLFSAPMVLNGTLTVGGMQLMGASFFGFYTAVTGLVSNYQMFALLRSAATRIYLFDSALSQPVSKQIEVKEGQVKAWEVRGAQLNFPDGRLMVAVDDMTLVQGDRVLIKGRSGVGKSTLLRAFAGIWRFGAGSVSWPVGAKVKFLPQRSYMPDATLATLLSYPLPSDAYTDDDYRRVLNMLSLSAYCEELHTWRTWSTILSPGEQQRVAGARALLARPDYLFFDEATSALDEDSENEFYSAFASELPEATIVSVAHRPGVARFHHKTILVCDRQAAILPA